MNEQPNNNQQSYDNSKNISYVEETFSPELEFVLKEMCSRVNADYNTINFKEDQWYWKYEWTIEEENDFKDWLTNLLKKDKKVRKVIMAFPSLKDYKGTANMFVMNYGWRTIRRDKTLTEINETK